MKKLILVLVVLISLLFGVLIGGYLFRGVEPRSILAFDQCQQCFSEEELWGLLVSAGVQRMPGLIPGVIAESDKSVALWHPFPEKPFHVLILPKVDIKDVSELEEEDGEVIADMFGIASSVINKYQLKKYRMITNGEGFQAVRFLHFHLQAEERVE